jgi:hypothetical protein
VITNLFMAFCREAVPQGKKKEKRIPPHTAWGGGGSLGLGLRRLEVNVCVYIEPERQLFLCQLPLLSKKPASPCLIQKPK